MTLQPGAAQHPTHGHAPHAAHGAGSRGPADHPAPAHDEHGLADERLGRVDLAAWGAGLLGVALGLATAFAFLVGSGRLTL